MTKKLECGCSILDGKEHDENRNSFWFQSAKAARLSAIVEFPVKAGTVTLPRSQGVGGFSFAGCSLSAGVLHGMGWFPIYCNINSSKIYVGVVGYVEHQHSGNTLNRDTVSRSYGAGKWVARLRAMLLLAMRPLSPSQSPRNGALPASVEQMKEKVGALCGGKDTRLRAGALPNVAHKVSPAELAICYHHPEHHAFLSLFLLRIDNSHMRRPGCSVLCLGGLLCFLGFLFVLTSLDYELMYWKL